MESITLERCIDNLEKEYNIFYPKNYKEITTILQNCQQNKTSIYPVSSGNNWGYGSATANSDDTKSILNLSRMPGVISFNEEDGILTFGPGLNQEQLYKFLKENNYAYMVPTTGAGPEGNILGNLLERGYGIAPIYDHSESLISLKAVLPDGSIYQSSLAEVGLKDLDSKYKWGVGPYLDMIFSQSNYGVVYEASIKLAKIPSYLQLFNIGIDDNQLDQFIPIIKEFIQTYSGVVSGINIMSMRRMLSTRLNYKAAATTVLTDEEVREIASQYGIKEWTIMGAIYAPKSVSNAIKKELKKSLKKIKCDKVFIDSTKLNLWNKTKYLSETFSFFDLDMVNETYAMLRGIPSNKELNLSYSEKNILNEDKKYHPIKDRIGIVWFSPIIPFDAQSIRLFINTVNHICLTMEIEPMITLSTVSTSALNSSIPILFDKDSSIDQSVKANACYKELLNQCMNKGFFPYRLPVNHQSEFYDRFDSENKLSSLIKKTLDPNNILAPGRYIPKQ